MMLLSPIIQTFEADFLATYQDVLPSQLKALATMKQCRTTQSPVMLAQCDDCEHQCFIPHSCGHRSCPHCQHYESEQWLQRQLKKQVPAEYFLLTFTLPAEFRSLAWQHQHTLYELMIRCSWETLKTFTRNDQQLQGDAGAISVLHTHSRRLDYHPHVHVVMPAAAIDTEKQLWRTKKSKGEHTRPTCSTTRPWQKCSAPNCSRPFAKQGLSCRTAIPKPGWWTVSPSVVVTKHWFTLAAIFTRV
jgi:Transposase zinc-binding domain/Putative transposase